MTTRAAIYTRISKNNPNVPKVENQEAMCRDLAEKCGYEVVLGGVYVDDGITASAFKNRPGWRQMLDDAGEGRFDVLLAQSEDRFTRQPMEKEALMFICAEVGITWHTVQEGTTDPATADGEFFALMRGGMHRWYSRGKAEKQRKANDLLVAKGLPLPGGARPFGYQDDKVTPHEVEAPLIREAYADLVSGKRTLSRIRTDWNAAGITTVRGNPWDLPKVEKVLRRPKNAGYVQHRGGYDPARRGTWETVVDEATFAAAIAILDDPRRRLSKVTEARHLCSSIAKCGSCGTSMRVAGISKGEAAYRCGVHDGAAHKVSGLRHTSIRCSDLDRLVTDAVVSAVLMAPADSVPDTDAARLRALHADLRDVHQALANLVSLVRSETFTLAEVAAEKAALTSEADQIDGEIARIKQRNAQASLMAEAQAHLWVGGAPTFLDAASARKKVRAEFESMDLASRRALVKGLLRITVGRGRDLGRVQIRHLVAPALNETEEDEGLDRY